MRRSLASSSAQYSIRNASRSSRPDIAADRLGAAHHVDRIAVELAGKAGGGLVRRKASGGRCRARARRPGSASRIGGSPGVGAALVVGLVAGAIGRQASASYASSSSRADPASAARSWCAGNDRGRKCRWRPAARSRDCRRIPAPRRRRKNGRPCARAPAIRPRSRGISFAATARRSRGRAVARRARRRMRAPVASRLFR